MAQKFNQGEEKTQHRNEYATQVTHHTTSPLSSHHLSPHLFHSTPLTTSPVTPCTAAPLTTHHLTTSPDASQVRCCTCPGASWQKLSPPRQQREVRPPTLLGRRRTVHGVRRHLRRAERGLVRRGLGGRGGGGSARHGGVHCLLHEQRHRAVGRGGGRAPGRRVGSARSGNSRLGDQRRPPVSCRRQWVRRARTGSGKGARAGKVRKARTCRSACVPWRP